MTTGGGTIVGVILAGGLSRRMGGGDKGLADLGGRPMLTHIVERLRPQVTATAIAVAGDPGRFAALGLPVLDDAVPDRPGPLAGILAGLDWAVSQGATHLLSAPCDTPLLPTDLAARLGGRCQAGAVASSGRRTHPVVACWPVGVRARVGAALESHETAVGPLVRRLGFDIVDWPVEPVDPFLNVNRPDDLAAAELALGLLRPEAG